MLFELTVTNLAFKTHLSAYDAIGFIAKYYQLLNASSYKGYCSKILELTKKSCTSVVKKTCQSSRNVYNRRICVGINTATNKDNGGKVNEENWF